VAKEELSVNLHTRLRWIMYVEKTLSDVDNKISIYFESVKRLKRRLDVVHQVRLGVRVRQTLENVLDNGLESVLENGLKNVLENGVENLLKCS
jgi:hypothetical protein